MKQSTILTTAITLALSSQLVSAGPVTDTYTAGDTLTTTILDNIKTAVNDNNAASRFYGDGSAGALTINGSAQWILTTLPPGSNLNFTNIEINEGSILGGCPRTNHQAKLIWPKSNLVIFIF